MEELDNIITLVDGDGVEIDFEILDIIEHGEYEYAVLLPADDDSDEAEAVVLRILPSDDPETDTLEGVDDEALLDELFALYLERNAGDAH